MRVALGCYAEDGAGHGIAETEVVEVRGVFGGEDEEVCLQVGWGQAGRVGDEVFAAEETGFVSRIWYAAHGVFGGSMCTECSLWVYGFTEACRRNKNQTIKGFSIGLSRRQSIQAHDALIVSDTLSDRRIPYAVNGLYYPMPVIADTRAKRE